MGGNDWDAIRDLYGSVAKECLDASSINEVVNMMLGDLNGSHLGFRYQGSMPNTPSPNQWTVHTGHLGARFVADHKGEGLLIRDVIKETPAYREDSRLYPGDVILKVDGKDVNSTMDLGSVFGYTSGQEFLLNVRSATGEEREVHIRPTSYGRVRSALYEHWIEYNRELVEKESNGTLAYVHIAGMGMPELYRFDEEIARVAYGKDGLIIDVRNNGGGSTTDHLLTMLTQPTHALCKTREGPIGYPQDRRVYATWDKPIIVLCNQNSFSNAEIFSHAIKTLKRGKVVGVPTAGGVISTGGASLMGGAFIRLPGRGWYVLNSGQDMELNGCIPDIIHWPLPGELPSGTDHQLLKAISEHSKDVAASKASPKPSLLKASER
jgi:tricorn protease